MKTLLKWLLAAIALCLSGFVALFILTRGDATVAPLVTQDATLPARQIAGNALHMRISDGPGDGQTVIVLHGGPGGDFRSLLALEALSDRHRVVFYDQRGAGLSQRVTAADLTLDGYLAELDAVIGHTAPDRPVILIGHSWGAMLATAYLAHRPDRVARAVLIEPGYLDAAGRASWEARARRYMSGLSYGVAALLNGTRAAHVTDPDMHAQDDFLIGRMAGLFASHPENPYHCGAGYSAPQWRFGALASAVWRDMPLDEIERIARGTGFRGPVLLLAGACNTWTGAPLQSRHLALFPNARLAVIPEAGHDVVWDNPQATLAALRAFMAGGETGPMR